MGRGLSSIVAVAFAVAAFAFGIRVAELAGSAGQGADAPWWQTLLAGGLFVAALACFVTVTVRMLALRKRPGYAAWRSLTASQRRHVTRQLRGRLPVQASEVAFLRSIAFQRKEQRVMVLHSAGLVLLAGGSILSNDGSWQLGLSIFIAAIATLSVGLTSYDVSSMAAFLTRHPQPQPAPYTPGDHA